MIELPEGLVLAEQLDRELRDKRITDVRANTSPHRFAWYDGDPAAYPIRFTGREIEGAHSYGGKVHLRLKGSGRRPGFRKRNIRFRETESSLPAKGASLR